jgi:hypothetical protein
VRSWRVVIIISVLAFGANEAKSQERHADYKVTYGIVLNGEEPKGGETTCVPEETCVLIDDGDIRLEFTIPRRSNDAAELYVNCGQVECSFSGGRPKAEVRDQSSLYLFEGRDLGIMHDLLARFSRTVGSVRLDVRLAP